MKSPKPLIFLILFLMLSSFNAVYADPDIQITVSTDRQIYGSDDLVNISGDLTRDETPVSNALIAIQVNDAHDNKILIRTLSTGTPPSPWFIDIIDAISTDSSGNPKDTFRKGSQVRFDVIVKNLDKHNRFSVTITINLFDSSLQSFGMSAVIPGRPLDSEEEYWCCFYLPISQDASIGTAYAFVNAYNRWPEENGVAYCAEKTVAFMITDGSSSSSSDSTASQSSASEGMYELTFKLRSKPGLGDNTVYASYYQTLATATFDVVWLFTDIDRNGVVGIGDLYVVAKAYDSQVGDPRWNSKADISGDGLVNIMDLYRVARDYGKTRT